MSGLRFNGKEDMPPGMRRLMEAQEARKAGTPVPVVQAGVAGGTVPQKGNKYHNIATEVDGVRFQSLKEARRYGILCRAVELGVIEDLRLQVDFTLQEGYTTNRGERIRAIRYKADFTYRVRSAGYDKLHLLDPADIEYWRSLWPGALVIEDTKTRGTRTEAYKIKRKLMAEKGYEIREV